MEDKKLLRLLHKDPNAGMEQLLNQYTGLVYAVVKSKLDGSYYVSSDLEDCVADVFSKFYAEFADYDPAMPSIKSYLCVIARNHAINVAKKRNLEGGISLDDEQSLLQVADDVMIDSALENEELLNEPHDVSLETNALYMGVKSQRSKIFDEKEKTARDFFSALDTYSGTEEEKSHIEELFDSYMQLYSDDPVFVAKLKLAKISKLNSKKK